MPEGFDPHANYIINIEGLPKYRVLLALYNNVYRKSAASTREWNSLNRSCFRFNTPMPGMNSPVSAEEAQYVLSKTKKIGMIGAVLLNMDFSDDKFICTEEYDSKHQTYLDQLEIQTAEKCIEALRKQIKLEQSKAPSIHSKL